MHIKISIEDKIKKHLQDKGNILTISRRDIQRGCMGLEDIDISYEVPQEEGYEKYLVDGVTVYVQHGLQFKDNHIKVVKAGVGPFQTVAVGSLDRGTL